MNCQNCTYSGIIDQNCPNCGIDIYSDEYVALAEGNE